MVYDRYKARLSSIRKLLKTKWPLWMMLCRILRVKMRVGPRSAGEHISLCLGIMMTRDADIILSIVAENIVNKRLHRSSTGRIG